MSRVLFSSDRLRLQQAAPSEGLLEQRLDFVSNTSVRVACPRYVGFQIQRRAQGIAARISHDDAHLSRDHFGAKVVRMAAYSRARPVSIKERFHKRAQVGNETVVPGHKPVKLPAARQILVFEAERLARHDVAQRSARYLFVDRGKFVTGPREEPGHRGKSMPDVAGPRGVQV